MIVKQDYSTFLALVRFSIGHYVDRLPEQINWDIVQALAAEHGLSALLLDGIELLPDTQRPPKDVLLNWIGSSLQIYDYRYEPYEKTIAELASFYNAHGYKMMLLKGYGCGIDWPKPEHRPCGDIDIWLFGKQKEADVLLTKEKGISIDGSHQHHTVFMFGDFQVENHYDFINVHHHESNTDFETILKDLGQDDSNCIEVLGEKIYLPAPNLNALFLLKHSMMHFAAEGITLKQLLDWAFFVKKHTNDIDWIWLERVLEEYGMKKLYDVFNAICVGDLGFDVGIFNLVQFDSSLKEKVLNEILSPEFSIEPPRRVFKRIVFKLKRWKGNAWKHKLCYKESMWSAFWSGVWNHLLKPSSI